MPGDTSVGSVSLAMQLDDVSFLAQVESVAKSASAILQENMNKGFRVQPQAFDMSGPVKEITKGLTDITKSVDFLSDKIQAGMEKGAVSGKASMTRAMDNMKMPTIKVDLNAADLQIQLDNLISSLDNTNAKIYTQEKALGDLRLKWDALNAAGAGNGTEGSALQAKILRAESALIRLQGQSEKMVTKSRSLENAISKFGATAKKEVAEVGIKGEIAGKKVSSGMQKAADSMTKTGHSGRSASNMIERVWRRVTMLFILNAIRNALRGLGQDFIEVGNQSKPFGALINSFAAKSDQLKGAFAAMFMPLATMAIPILNQMMSVLTDAFNRAAIFFGALSGAKSVMIAVGSMKQYTKAIEENKRSQAGFDTLNILSKKAPESETPGTIFQEVSTEGATKGFDFLKENINGFWKKVQETKSFRIMSEGAKKAFLNILLNGRQTAEKVRISWKTNAPLIAQSLENILPRLSEFWSNIGSMALTSIGGMIVFYLQMGGTMVSEGLALIQRGASLYDAATKPIFESINAFFTQHKNNIETMITESWKIAADSVSGIIEGLSSVIKGIFLGLAAWFIKNGTEVQATLSDVWNTVWSVIGPIWNAINSAARATFGGIKDFLTENSTEIKNAVVAVWDYMYSYLSTWWSVISSVIKYAVALITEIWDVWGGNLKQGWTNTWEAIKNIFSSVVGVITGIFQGLAGIFDIITGALTGNFTKISEGWNKLWTGMKSIFFGVINAISGTFEFIVNNIINAINVLTRGLNQIKLPNWSIFGDLAGKGINIPLIGNISIPKLATGGIVTQPTLAMVGEAGKEAVMPLDQIISWFKALEAKIEQNPGDGGDIYYTHNTYLDTGELVETFTEKIKRKSRQQNKPILEN